VGETIPNCCGPARVHRTDRAERARPLPQGPVVAVDDPRAPNAGHHEGPPAKPRFSEILT
jgi:hypothetical protein